MKLKSLNSIILFAICITVLASCGISKVNYFSGNRNITIENIQENLENEPNETKTTEDGGTEYIYQKSVFDKYTGSMTYQYYDNMLFLSKWTHKEKTEEKAKKAYKSICESLTTQYKAGEESEDRQATTFETEDRYVIAAYAKSENTYDVCITEMMK